MKNKKTVKYLLSGIVVLLMIILNIDHCHKNQKSSYSSLVEIFKVASCEAEATDDRIKRNPILRSPGQPDDGMSEEEYLELLRRRR